MKSSFTALLIGHGLIHLIGVAKAFGLAEVSQLSQPISRPVGFLWLAAALTHLSAAISLYVWPRWLWVVGGCAVAVSQVVIMTSWGDAKWGTLANVVVLAGAAYGCLSLGPFSFQAQFDRAVAEAMRNSSGGSAQVDDAKARLPILVEKYLTATGTGGRHGVRNLRARLRGEIRSGPTEPWMKFTAEQFNTFGGDPTRMFLMNASRAGVPFEALHIYADGRATMRVKLASLWTVVDAKGPEMNQAETVTVLNDMCLLAPSTLASTAIRWEEAGHRSVRAVFSNKGHSIGAILTFDESGELANFVSDDRFRSSPDGKTFQQTRWSTPVANYRDFGEARLWSTGEARWHPEEGGFAYGRFELVAIGFNVDTVSKTGSVRGTVPEASLGVRGAR